MIDPPTLTPAEFQRLLAAGQAPDDFIPLDVALQVDRTSQVRVGTINGTEVAVVTLQLAFPTGGLRTQRILGLDGTIPSPLDGMFPVLSARMVIRKADVQPALLARMGIAVPTEIEG